MKSWVAVFALSLVALPVWAAEDAQQICGDKPCELTYKLVDDYAIKFEGRKETPANFSEGVLLLPKDGMVKGTPPKIPYENNPLDMAAVESMAKTAGELLKELPAARQQKTVRLRGSNGPELDPNYSAPFVQVESAHAEQVLSDACEQAKDAVLDVAMTNVLMRAGQNNPFMGASGEMKNLQSACGEKADTVLGQIKEQVDLMERLHNRG
ncbi:MAG: hypothetical protein GC134_09795 [Proteobacteria bacterium]|nr:hypothetical protein [Pseudomonadota bacterium]